MKNEPESAEVFVIPPHTLYAEYPPKIPEDEIKETNESGEVVLSRVVIPDGVRFLHFFLLDNDMFAYINCSFEIIAGTVSSQQTHSSLFRFILLFSL